jgi:hypothetical protein
VMHARSGGQYEIMGLMQVSERRAAAGAEPFSSPSPSLTFYCSTQRAVFKTMVFLLWLTALLCL